MRKRVGELMAGELFIWGNQPDYLNQMTDEDFNRTMEDDRPFAYHVATRTEGDSWRFHTDGRGNKWNPYCMVQVVLVNVTE